MSREVIQTEWHDCNATSSNRGFSICSVAWYHCAKVIVNVWVCCLNTCTGAPFGSRAGCCHSGNLEIKRKFLLGFLCMNFISCKGFRKLFYFIWHNVRRFSQFFTKNKEKHWESTFIVTNHAIFSQIFSHNTILPQNLNFANNNADDSLVKIKCRFLLPAQAPHAGVRQAKNIQWLG